LDRLGGEKEFPELRLSSVAEAKEDRAEFEGGIWYCLLGKSILASRDGGGVDL
jgi:hypothetical protein